MRKKREQKAKRKEENERIAKTFLGLDDGRGFKDILAVSGYHRLRRIFQTAIAAGEGVVVHRGFYRYLKNRFCPELSENATWQEVKEVLDSFDAMLKPVSIETVNKVEAEILRLGRLVPPGWKGK